MNRRTDGNSWAEFIDMRMKQIDADYKRELLGSLAVPFACVVAWLILAVS